MLEVIVQEIDDDIGRQTVGERGEPAQVAVPDRSIDLSRLPRQIIPERTRAPVTRPT